VKVKIGELNEAEVAALPAQPENQAPETAKIEALGMSLAEVTPDLREKFQLDQEAAGVLVIGVAEGSPAAEKGLQPGDVVVEVDQKEVATPQDVEAQISTARQAKQRVVTFLIYRQGDFQWVALRIDQG
jgi:serine protease Do